MGTSGAEIGAAFGGNKVRIVSQNFRKKYDPLMFFFLSSLPRFRSHHRARDGKHAILFRVPTVIDAFVLLSGAENLAVIRGNNMFAGVHVQVGVASVGVYSNGSH